jgi:hypothetical protein
MPAQNGQSKIDRMIGIKCDDRGKVALRVGGSS